MSKKRRQESLCPLIPSALHKLSEALLDQQMWCWGCDVRRASGNLLLAYGFEQRPSPNPRFHSAYTVRITSSCTLTLWGWGLWVAAPERGSVFASRDRFRVRWTPQTDLAPLAWQERDLPRGSADVRLMDALFLLREAALWIAGYERWVGAHCDPDYRPRAIDAWPQKRQFKGGISSEKVADQWETIADKLTVLGAPTDG